MADTREDRLYRLKQHGRVLLDGLVLLEGALDLPTQVLLLKDIIKFGEVQDTASVHIGMQKAAGRPTTKLNKFFAQSHSRVNILCDELLSSASYLQDLLYDWTSVASELSPSLPPFFPSPSSSSSITRLNYYPPEGRIGWHADTVPGLSRKNHLQLTAPIISLSLGNDATFLYRQRMKINKNEASIDEEEEKEEDEAEQISSLILRSGDVLLFGGPMRMLYHSVPKIHVGTIPPVLLSVLEEERMPNVFRCGRFNLTFRQKEEVERAKEDGEEEEDLARKFSDREIMAGLHLYAK
ncbi:putative DNA oxidative demethylase [Balamuthia mandrillaris]